MDRTVRLRQHAAALTKRGDAVTGMAAAFPKSPPPPGLAYSRNFSRFHQAGAFAVQTRD
jgi:hypothetical protein